MDETKEAKKVTLPLLVTRGLFVFPHLTETIDAGREFSKKAIELSRNENASLLFVTAQKDPSQDQLTAEGIYEIGTICRITGFTEKTGSYQIRVIGSHRATLSNIRLENGSFVADGFPFDEETADAEEENRLRSELMRAIGENQRLLTSVPKSAIVSFSRATSSSELIASLAAYLPLEIPAKAAILAESSVNEELKKLIAFLNEQKEMAEIDDKLNQTVRERAEQNQKEYFLREKMKGIGGMGKSLAGGMTADAYAASEFASYDPEHIGHTPIGFSCPCSKEHFSSYLRSLPDAEKSAMLEGAFPLVLTCVNCGSEYSYTEEETKELFRGSI